MSPAQIPAHSTTPWKTGAFGVSAPTWLRLGLTGALVLGLGYAFGDALGAMVSLWSRNPMYSYAYAVPVISAWLIWSRREQLATLGPAPSWRLACPVLALGALMLVGGRLGSIQILEQLAFLVSLVGVVLAVLGAAYVRVAWAGLAYLLLMIPIWDGLTDPLHPRFQSQSAALGIAILRAVGIPAYRESTMIALPNIELEVARACSGVNYLIAVIALGLPLAYVQLTGIWRRALLVGGAVVVAALSNGLRVALIGALAYWEIGSPLHGPMHVLHGLFVAGIGYVVLFAGLRLLRNRSDAPAPNAHQASAPATHLAAARPATIAALAGLFVLLGAVVGHDDVAAVSLRAPLDRLPRSLGAWVATSGASDPRVLAAWQSADERVLRRYRAPDGRTLDIFVAYYGAQRQNRELTSYLTADLHRGASVREVALPDGSHLQVNFVERIDGRPLPAMFWYELGESVETGQYTTKLQTMWRALSHRRTDGAVVVISSPYGSSPASLSGLEEFAALAYEALGTSFPRTGPATLTKSST